MLDGSIHCPACGATNGGRTMTLTSARGRGRWLRCARCRAYSVIEHYDVAHESEQHAQAGWGIVANATQLNAYKQRLFGVILVLVTRLRPPPGTFLDVGAAFGGLMILARARGYEVRGTEINRAAIDYVRGLGMPIDFAPSIADLPDEARFDVIACIDSNMYWADQPRELRAAFARLRPGGLLVVRAVDRWLLVHVGALLAARLPGLSARLVIRGASDFRSCMPFRSLIRTIRDAGFEIAYASPRGAVHSHQTSRTSKVAFALGTFAWERLGLSLGPGGLIVAKKGTRG